jgi:quinol monooxygenase YgiN
MREKRRDMAIRLIVTIAAAPGRGAELAQLYSAYCAEVMQEPGCEQFEIFQSVVNPDKLVLLERWSDKAALDVHALTSVRPTLPPELRVGTSEREDYEYNRTR